MADDTPATSDQVERLLRHFETHDRRDGERLMAIHRRLDQHGEFLARIDERTRQHEGRMDRADRRSGAISGVVGVLIAGAAEGIRRLLTGEGGG